MSYDLRLMAPDGDYVNQTLNAATIQEAWDYVNAMGSRWIFYPIPFVVQCYTIEDAPEQFKAFVGAPFQDVVKYIKSLSTEDQDNLFFSFINS